MEAGDDTSRSSCALLEPERSQGSRMSYARMDHAAWMESNNHALNHRRKEGNKLPEKLSDFQAKVIDIVGMVGGGIYNAPICQADKIQWRYGFGGMSLTWNRELSTWDFEKLTLLVFLCHEARIRCELEAVAPRTMRMSFWQRKATGDVSVRHPNLTEAVNAFFAYLPADHRIRYQDEENLQRARVPGEHKTEEKPHE